MTTEPLTPPECDLRDFAFMPLEVARLRRSKAWLAAKRRPELAFYMINLWTASWHDLPAASLEDDDEVLADLAMCDPTKWARLRADVMRGWIKCSDGRLYHPVVAEKALTSWASKVAQRERTEAARIAAKEAREKKRSKHLPNGGQPPDGGDTDDDARSVTQSVTRSVTELVTQSVTDPVTERVTDSVTQSVTHSVTKSKGEGEGEGEEERALLRNEPTARDRLWGIGLPALVIMTGMPDRKARNLIGRFVKDAGDNCGAVLQAIENAMETRPLDPVPWLTEAVKARTGRRQSNIDRIRSDWHLPTLAEREARRETAEMMDEPATRTIQ